MLLFVGEDGVSERGGCEVVIEVVEIVDVGVRWDRKIALSNDYLNFYAPGDDIFDCITKNAINSYKGTCSAFAFK